MFDILGNELSEGDKVVYIGSHYKQLHRGIILSISKQRVKVARCKSQTWDMIDINDKYTYRQCEDFQVIKVNEY